MGVIVPPGFGSAAVELTSTQGTSPFICTIGVNLVEADGDFVGVANRVFNTFKFHFQARMANIVSCQRVILAVGSESGNGSVVSTEAPWTGTVSTASEVISMAPCLYKNTAQLGRRGRGKMMIPGILRETDVGTSGEIDATPRTAILGMWNGFLEDLTETIGVSTPPAQPVLLHSAPSTWVPSPILNGSIRPKVAWIRGRLF